MRVFLSVCGVALVAASASVARPAQGQVHWDAQGSVGVAKRFLATRAADDAGLGPLAELRAHVAILPLLRAGVYASHEISPEGPAPARQLTAFGARFKIGAPWPQGDVRMYLFAGFGYALAYSRSYHASFPLTAGAAAADISVDGASGRFFEVPLGLGVLYKLRKPWVLSAELGTRLAIGASGGLYRGRTGHAANAPEIDLEPAGNESVAVGLTVGVGFDL